jgi:hypothetical protein
MRELVLHCQEAQAEALSDALLEAGGLSVSVEDADFGTEDERPLFGEPGTEPDVQAWQYLDPDLAIAQSRVLDQSGRRGPLQGVPVGIKDLIDTFDMPTEYGTVIHARYQPRIDAACVALTRRAGGLIQS